MKSTTLNELIAFVRFTTKALELNTSPNTMHYIDFLHLQPAATFVFGASTLKCFHVTFKILNNNELTTKTASYYKLIITKMSLYTFLFYYYHSDTKSCGIVI